MSRSRRIALSPTLQQELYNAIFEEIMDMRMDILRGKYKFSEAKLEKELYNMESRIWKRQAKILGIE